ncbi:hypothetical protein C1637_23985 [Chryseobacterium lactis]|uniref:Uncharacterized protein n=1 Tax=Chryseobacterium lactis TaxID=1241981 RepID=A0A3G6RQC2_CHRLC|nr:hypothetical protein [Chryseobacterium lactis]AZA83265.1 hypothetical protein EG342_15885 [Chryseobacterium lactis]AZB03650.1 hypothetical protein EG341_06755 [Chryseobacterium lactis]PNW11140.1 hypothetical protein C1637_23985 [Chryseobacterium lactis]
MSLVDFYPYIEEIIEKNNGAFYIESKNNKGDFFIEKVTHENFKEKINDDREKNLGFFIFSEDKEVDESMIYKDDFAPFVIVGEGGREKKDSIERINLRVLSKNPEKNTSKIFSAIKNKLKKDESIGMGIEGGSALHNNYFYQKNLVGKKIFKTDFYNDKAPLIVVK